MRYLDLETWPRKNHYHFFRTMDYPHFNVCANVDVTRFQAVVKANGLSFFKTFLYAVVRTANELKEFRYRIREKGVVEHDAVHPSFTLMTSEDVFRFTEAKYHPELHVFLEETAKVMDAAKDTVYIEDEPGRDDLLYVTCLPWVSFTSVQHPIHMDPHDSVPRFAWGKFFEENGKVKVPLGIQVHHALVDGVHVGQFFMRVQEVLDEFGEIEKGTHR
ncbi:chloramphenicol O-acetyltransferase type A [Tumebacillus sp. BK434]|uniref:chloramphenicol acetyltransferase n=1 Tax=Tumebacillus sp. BK434 TaxID=2512169 RepID=UPI001043CF51|nr:chloramphenicol acetyltransferase [Tumebacillus sp. BK434]TCP56037.1 chloramphenicol O-acetyltransferase type A [Tumebacillus sp. BK434]